MFCRISWCVVLKFGVVWGFVEIGFVWWLVYLLVWFYWWVELLNVILRVTCIEFSCFVMFVYSILLVGGWERGFGIYIGDCLLALCLIG